MKRKKIFFYISVLLLIMAIGCKDDIVNPESTIEGRINAQKPLETIIIHNFKTFTRNDPDESKKIRSAYAENGYFIVVSESGEKYNFNLATVQHIQILKHRVDIYY